MTHDKQQPFDEDIVWLIDRCHAEGLPAPDAATMETFAEQVAIKLTDVNGNKNFFHETQAREDAYLELMT